MPGYVWSDVKPGNFVYVTHERKWKAIDLESVNPIGSQLQACSCVTIRYAPPEIALACKNRSIQKLRADVAVDAWSLGMTLLCIFAAQGGNYFDMQHLDRTADIIRHLTSEKCERFLGRYVEKTVADQSYTLEKQAIQGLLQPDIQLRRSATEVSYPFWYSIG